MTPTASLRGACAHFGHHVAAISTRRERLVVTRLGRSDGVLLEVGELRELDTQVAALGRTPAAQTLRRGLAGHRDRLGETTRPGPTEQGAAQTGWRLVVANSVIARLRDLHPARRRAAVRWLLGPIGNDPEATGLEVRIDGARLRTVATAAFSLLWTLDEERQHVLVLDVSELTPTRTA